MNAVIMGCGRVGILLTQQLCKAGADVTVIDKRAQAFDRLPPGFQARTMVGLGFDRDVLEGAGIQDADAFIAVSSGDNSNIVSARVAREHYHVPQVIARIYDPARAEIYERLNIPTVATTKWGVKQIMLMLHHPRDEVKESLAGGDLFRMRMQVPTHLVGKPVSSINAEGRILVVGVERGGKGFIPVADSTFQERDHVALIVQNDALDELDDLLAPVENTNVRVVITGAGAVGRHLAADLHGRAHEVTLIEQDPNVLEKAEDWAPGVDVLLGDACEPWVLEKADLASADVVVAATGDDEDNLVTSLLSKQEFAVPRVLARVNYPGNEWLFTAQWGVDAAVSPPHILTSLVEEAVTVGDLVRLLRLEGGRVALAELRLPAGSPSAGRAIYELRMPTDTAIVAILRDGHVVIPQPETVLADGDEVLALASPGAEVALRAAIVGDGVDGSNPSGSLDGAGSI